MTSEVTKREIWLLRHAKARQAEAGQQDIDRALSGRGLRQCRQISGWLAERLGSRPISILVSPARRTRETARHVFGDWSPNAPQTVDAIWNASVAGLLHVVEDHPGELVLVGHNPGLEQLQYRLTGQLLPLPTGGVFRLALPTSDTTRAELLERFQPASDST